MANIPGQVTYTNPRGHQVQQDSAYRTWSQSLVATTLVAQDNIGIRHRWGIPRGHEALRDSSALRSWTWPFNVALYVTPAALPFNQEDWPLPRAYPPQHAQRTWTWNYNLNLIGKDELYLRHVYGAAEPPPWYRDWSQNLLQTTLSPVVVRPFSQYDWPLSQRIPPSAPSWSWSYNLNLIGQDRFPAGTRVHELPPRDFQRAPPSWAWWYNLNLIAQDRLPAGKIFSDRPPPSQWYRDWSQNLLQTTLGIVIQLPFNQFDWPVQRDYLRSPPSWATWYNLNLIGKDRLPSGKIHTDRPPPSQWYRDWSQNLLQTTLSVVVRLPFNQFDWQNPRDYLRAAPSWTWSYNINLIGQDALYIRQVYRIPSQHFVREYREWTQNLLQSTLRVVGTPVGQRYLELPPRDYLRSPPSWTWWYNLNLIGKDELFLRHVYGAAEPPPWYRDWSLNLLQTTLGPVVVRLPTGQIITDLAPRGPLQPDRFWAWSYNLNLIGKDQFPAGQRHLELPPRDYQRSPPSWAWWYNLNLIAQDRLPTGDIITDRPPPVAWYRDWSLNLLQNTLAVAFTPFNQFDWALPRDYQRVTPSWTAFYNVNLIGKDQLPVGKIVTALTPLGPEYPTALRSWIGPQLFFRITAALPFNTYDWPLPKVAVAGVELRVWSVTYNPNLIGQDRFPPGQITTALTPIGVTYPASMYSFTASPAVPPTPIVVTTDIHCLPIQSTVGQLRSF